MDMHIYLEKDEIMGEEMPENIQVYDMEGNEIDPPKGKTWMDMVVQVPAKSEV